LRIPIKIFNRLVLVLVVTLSLARNGAGESATERGATEFHEKGCPQCHAINGIGGHKGPDLSGVGRRKNKSELRKQILEGGGAMPAFREALTGDEAEVLVRYLQHCRVKPAREAAPQLSVQ
jgi:ubiquinol-cytochrome c reductase cytochrome b subunit